MRCRYTEQMMAKMCDENETSEWDDFTEWMTLCLCAWNLVFCLKFMPEKDVAFSTSVWSTHGDGREESSRFTDTTQQTSVCPPLLAQGHTYSTQGSFV